jgi:RNA polymerase sigma-70 factor (ECF subfamily)
MMINYSKYKDVDLVAALKDKKQAESAFAELYTRHSNRIYSYCLRIMGTEEDAQDVFQETFLKFFTIALELKYTENVAAFLYRIARNACINYKRNLRSTDTIEDYKLQSNDRGYDQKEILQLIARAMELLDFESKEAFILRMYHGLSYAEIAEITGDTQIAVKNRSWRAKEKIKEILAPYLNEIKQLYR